MKELLLYLIPWLLYVFLGSYFLRDAIIHFKHKEIFLGSLNVMLAATEIFNILRIILKY